MPYYVTTNDASRFNFSLVNKIESLTVTASIPPGTDIRCVASFDGRQTWKKYNGNWVDGDIKTDNNSIAELQAGFINLIRTTQQYVDLAFVLVSTNSLYTPAIDFVTIVYQDNSYYEMASVGATSAGNTDFGVRRIDPTATVVKKLNDVAGKVFITRTIN